MADDVYAYIDIPGIGLKKVLVASFGDDVADFGSLDDVYVTLNSGKRGLITLVGGIPNNIKIVKTINNFPDPEGDFIRLENKNYLLDDDISTALKFKAPVSGIAMISSAAANYKLIYTGTSGALFEDSAMTGSLFLFQIGLSSPAPASSLFDIIRDGSGEIIVDTVGLSDVANLGTIEAGFTSIDFCVFDDWGQGLIIDGGSFGMHNTSYFDGKNEASAVMLTTQGTITFLSIVNIEAVANGANESIFDIKSTGLYPNGGVFSLNKLNIGAGGSIFASGSLTQKSPPLLFSTNPGVPDSTIFGGYFTRDNVTQSTITDLGIDRLFQSASDAGGGQVQLNSSDTSGLSNGQTIWITNDLYNGKYTISNLVANVSFEITAVFVGTASGDIQTGWVKVAGATIADDNNERASMPADNELLFSNLELTTVIASCNYAIKTTAAVLSTIKVCIMCGDVIAKLSITEIDLFNDIVQGFTQGSVNVTAGDTVSVFVRNMSSIVRHPIMVNKTMIIH